MNVKTYGAVGDGITDDTAAVQRAIAAIQTGVLFFPAGTYILSKQIVIQQSGVVVRGAGAGATTLSFTQSLTDIFGQTWKGYGPDNTSSPYVNQSDYKSGPGLLRFAGPKSLNLAGPGHPQIGLEDQVNDATLLAIVTQNARRGDVVLYVSNTSAVTSGQWITLALSDKNSLLLNALYGYIPVPRPCTGDCINEPRVMRFHSRVFAVRKDLGYIVLERPLPWDISTQWLSEVHAFMPDMQQSGVEELTLYFKWSKYAGHLFEEGWNGIEWAGAANCWVRNVTFINSDNPLIIWKSSFITATGLSFSSSQSRGPYACHHNVNVTWSQDIHITNFRIDQRCVHDLTSFAWTNGVVFSSGSGININMDHHLLFPYSTLWSNIDLGNGDRAFLSSGETKWGMVSAALTTYYNIRASSNISSVPSATNGPFGNFLRLQWGPPATIPALAAAQGWLLDKTINPPKGTVADPVDLYAAMVATRTARFASLGREQAAGTAG